MASDTAQTRRRAATTGSEAQPCWRCRRRNLISHFYIMCGRWVLPLKERLNVSLLDLGLASPPFNVVTGPDQAPTGFLVDRIGARPVLIAG